MFHPGMFGQKSGTISASQRQRTMAYLLPGLLCDASVWSNQVIRLFNECDPRTPDFIGFDDIGAMAQAILDEAPPRFSVAGHSMGARVALEIVRLAPERVERLALLDTGIHPRREGEAEKRQVLVDLAYAEGMGALADRWLPPMVHPDKAADPAFMAPLRAMVERLTPDIHEKQIRALLNRPDALAGLKAVRCPVLLGVGRQDAWSPLAQHEEIKALLPHAKLVVFENSGHMSPLEAPEAVTAALLGWIKGPAGA